MDFSVCFGSEYPYVRESYQPYILCFPASVSVWHWCTLRHSQKWNKDVGFWWTRLLCRHLCTFVISFYSVHSETLQRCWAALPHHLYDMHVPVICSQTNYILLLLLFYWLHSEIAACAKQVPHPKSCKVTAASSTTDIRELGNLFLPLFVGTPDVWIHLFRFVVFA